QRGDDDERIEPGLEVHDDQEIDEHDGEGEAAEQADIRSTHGLDLAAQGDETPAGEVRPIGVHDARDVPAHRAEVAILHRTVDVDHPAGVVVRDHRHAAGAGDRGHVAQYLGP